MGLATALFVITVMAFLAVIINGLVEQNARSFEEELNLVRAFYAAESGAGLVVNTLFPPSGAAGSCPALTNYSFTADGINACSAAVACSSVTVDSVAFYTVESTGTCGEVSRTIQVRAQ